MRIRNQKRKFRWLFDTTYILADHNASVVATIDFLGLSSILFGFCRN